MCTRKNSAGRLRYYLLVPLAESVPNGINDGLEASTDVESSENVVHMAFDRLFAYVKLLGDFLVRAAFFEESKDFFFPRCELLLCLMPLFLYGVVAVQFSVDDPIHHFSFHPDLSFADALDGFYEILGGGAFG